MDEHRPGVRLLLPAILLLLAGPAAGADRWERYAVVVGADRGAAGQDALRYAEGDAARVAELLEELGGFPRERIHLLAGPDAETLRRHLATVEEDVARAGPGTSTLLLFFYSGHANTGGLELGDSLFSMDELKGYLRSSGAMVRIALVDACHSGALVRSKGGRRVEAFPLSMDLDATGYAVLTSSAAGERSQESDELRGSFFTHFVVSGLRGAADTSGDGQVTLDELYRYAYRRTLDRSLQAGVGVQHPTFDLGLSGRGELVLASLDRAAALLLFPAETEGNYLVWSEDRDRVVGEVDKPGGAASLLAVPAGELEVFKRGERRMLRQRLRVSPGETATVREDGLREIARTYLLEKGEGPSLRLSAGGGYQLFWDAGVRRASLLPSALGSVQLRLANWMHPRWDLSLRLTGGGGTGSIAPAHNAAAAMELVQFGAALGVIYHPLRRPVDLGIGLDAGILYAHRRTRQEGRPATTDDYVSVSPATAVSLGVPLGRIVTLELVARTGYYPFREDGRIRHLAFSEFLGGAEFRW
ncbi:MAG: caspase family protein [Deltaproteobacteria bacterium]|nr:caspase family protein [Deltaproteobacteria bacterium]